MNEFTTWLAQQNPAWLFVILPSLLLGALALSCANDARKEANKRAMPHTMTGEEYKQHNWERLRK